MPVNPNLELSVQQKMDLFRVEPDPADWQRIYEQLHPKKRRRFFFWLFPLAGAVLIGTYLYTTKARGDRNTMDRFSSAKHSSPDTAPLSPNTGQFNPTKNDTGASNHIQKAGIQQNAESSSATQPLATSDTTYSLSNQPGAPRTVTKTQTQVTATQTGKSSSTHREIPVLKISPSTQSNEAVLKTNASPDSLKKQQAISTGTHELIPGLRANQTDQARKNPPTANPAMAHIKQAPLQSGPINTADITPAIDSLAPAKKAAYAISEEVIKKIPNASTHKENGWYLGGYAEIGVNNPTDPISMAKSADLGNVPQANNVYQATSSRSAGKHYALGAILERKKKKFSVSVGLGLQQNTWSTGYVLYRDSIQSNGALYSRTQVSTKQTSYTQKAIEIPVSLYFRIAGKGPSSFWLGTGLNNAVTLGLREKSNGSFSNSNAGLDNRSTDSVRTGDATKYQPQFRVSLMYEHTGKINHWQASPFLQYGLGSMVKQGEPDIRMLHLGMQFRYFFKRLDGRH